MFKNVSLATAGIMTKFKRKEDEETSSCL